jgi:hypothetical protein
MRIGGIGGSAVGPTTRRAAPDLSAPQGAEAEPRALIAIEPAASTERPIARGRHPSAPFLAHLIATRMQAPQTRARRRAEPEEAIAAYRAGSTGLSAAREGAFHRTA